MLSFINLISGSGSTNLAVLEAEKKGGRLYKLTKTVAIISSSPKAKGIEKAVKAGFPKRDIYVVSAKKGNFSKELLKIFRKYKPDYFHQLGWLPKTPLEVLKEYKGLNQHLGPGGKGMYGERRIYVFLKFCEKIKKLREIPVFCQWVAPEYDEGDVIYLRYVKINPKNSLKEIAERLKKVEHKVQIEARYLLAKGRFKERPSPEIAKNKKEKEILREIIKEACKIKF